MKQFLTILVLFAILDARAQQQSKPGPWLFSRDIQAAADSEKNDWNLQEYAVDFSRMGDYRASLKVQKEFIEKNKSRRNIPKSSRTDSAFFAGFKPLAAIPEIIVEAARHQVTITNEAHYQPQNRVFTTALLEALYKKGYRYFLAESISEQLTDTTFRTRRYPLRTDGYYLPEPRYAELIRRALQIGYTIIPYEHSAFEVKDPGERFMAREKGQAANIAAILRKDPTAKILVHCGYGHLNERLHDSVGLMGAQLKLLYHIDPFTIDQQQQLEENDNPYYRLATSPNAPHPITVPSVFKSGAQYFSDINDNHLVDMLVFFPPTRYIHGRPDWLLYDKANRYASAQPLLQAATDSGLTYPIMILAYHDSEYTIPAAVPADIVECENPAAAKDLSLVLPPGKYKIKMIDRTGRTTSTNLNPR